MPMLVYVSFVFFLRVNHIIDRFCARDELGSLL
jgi:hypothetical protein